MLSDKTLIKISLSSFLILFVFVFHQESTYEMPIIAIDKLTKSDVEKRVAIKGEIVKMKLINENLFFTIKDNNATIIAVAFEVEKELSYNNEYIFEGKIVLYNNELELIVESIY